jgi:hypothetical protein
MINQQDLAELPLRAIVAFAVRCARRVRPLYRFSDPARKKAIDRALELAASFAKHDVGKYFRNNIGATAYDAGGPAASAAYAASDAYVGAFDDAAYAAYDAAVAAAHAAHNAVDVYEAADLDYRMLVSLNLGSAGSLGRFVDPSGQGPLGPLWPWGEPAWLHNSEAAKDAIRTTEPDAPSITFYFDTAEFTDEEIAEILGDLSDLYRSIGGDALIIDRTEALDPAVILEPVEV